MGQTTRTCTNNEPNVVNEDELHPSRSKRIKLNQLSQNLADNFPESLPEAKRSAKHWEIAVTTELDSLNKHNMREIVNMPEKAKRIKNKCLYTLKQCYSGETKYKDKWRLVLIK